MKSGSMSGMKSGGMNGEASGMKSGGMKSDGMQR
jgi:hypothetical protein